MRQRRRVDPHRRQRAQRLAHPHPVVVRVVVARVLDPRQTLPGQPGAQLGPPDRQQGAQPSDPLAQAPHRHGGQTIDPRPARQPHHEGLGLIVACMGQHHRAQPAAPRPIRQQPVARAARLILQVAAPIPALPAQHRVRHLETGTDARHLIRLGGGLKAQAVVHRGHPHRKPGLHRKMQQGDRIAPPGNRKAQRLRHRIPQALQKPLPHRSDHKQPNPCIATPASSAA